jgi:hypothetical protein
MPTVSEKAKQLEIEIGCRFECHLGYDVTIVAFNDDPEKKPIIAIDKDGGSQYFHFSQVKNNHGKA